ncbi:MAG TPA: pilus assembly protein PilM, partial [Lentisphaeria bacterium]|nr:pilus assembly protein PilM [Lentisphaeria bacterium]
ITGQDAESLDLMSIVIKNEIVEQFTAAVTQVGCTPILVDVAPAACYNAMRANGLGQDECVTVLNIGGRSTNLLFAEGERFYARTIPIAGHSITQQIAKEFGIGLPEAEELKRHHGFVALGGAYAEPESETAANVSKIIRNVMARLHGEIARSINYYRVQHKGQRPAKMYLTGGSSILSYCDIFFSEKLNIPVEYFNPFQVVNLRPTVDRQRLQEVAHMFSETIGLGLRYGTQCPIELSLIPITLRRQQNLAKKKPYLAGTLAAFLMILVVIWFGILQRTDLYAANNNQLKGLHEKAQPVKQRIEQASGEASQKKSQYEAIGSLLLQQAKWTTILNEIYRLKPDDLWISELRPIYGEVKPHVPVSAAGDPIMAGGGGPGGAEGGMFGGGGDMFGGGGFGGGGSEAAGSVATIGGLTISGSSLLPDKNKVAFTLGKEIPFPFEVDKVEPEPEPSPDGAEGETGKTMDRNAKIMAAVQKHGTTPELAFVTALRHSLLFDADETMTTITFYKTSSSIKNFCTFKIQVKFTMPVEFYQIKGKSTPPGRRM